MSAGRPMLRGNPRRTSPSAGGGERPQPPRMALTPANDNHPRVPRALAIGAAAVLAGVAAALAATLAL